jgi:4-hydroxy-tetrahydrodipicolinate reductase
MTGLRSMMILGTGAFGRSIAEQATVRGITSVQLVGRAENEAGRALTTDRLRGIDVVIDVSTAANVIEHATACLRAGSKLVIGTTGWSDRLPELGTLVRQHDGAVLHASNFATGVHRLTALLREADRLFPLEAGYATAMVETHHAAKRDAPSGTARQLAAVLRRPTPVTSVRVGQVPGTHELIIDGAFEQLRIVHEVRDRRLFAAGALDAADWLARTRTRGLFTMHDVLSHGEGVR